MCMKCCCFCFVLTFLITFICLQHFLWQYLHLHDGKIETTYINMAREKDKIRCWYEMLLQVKITSQQCWNCDILVSRTTWHFLPRQWPTWNDGFEVRKWNNVVTMWCTWNFLVSSNLCHSDLRKNYSWSIRTKNLESIPGRLHEQPC